jgi:hypothetical protein
MGTESLTGELTQKRKRASILRREQSMARIEFLNNEG